MTDKLDIFEVLQKINNHDVNFFDNLTDEQNKQIHPFVVQRWLSGTDNPLQISLINDHSNAQVFNTSHTNRLLAWYVLIACTIRGKQRYKWIKPPSKTTTGKSASIKVLKQAYNYSDTQGASAIQLLSVDDLCEIAEDLGWQQSEIQSIRKEHKSSKK